MNRLEQRNLLCCRWAAINKKITLFLLCRAFGRRLRGYGWTIGPATRFNLVLRCASRFDVDVRRLCCRLGDQSIIRQLNPFLLSPYDLMTLGAESCAMEASSLKTTRLLALLFLPSPNSLPIPSLLKLRQLTKIPK